MARRTSSDRRTACCFNRVPISTPIVWPGDNYPARPGDRRRWEVITAGGGAGYRWWGTRAMPTVLKPFVNCLPLGTTSFRYVSPFCEVADGRGT